MRSSSELQRSPMKFDIDMSKFVCHGEITLDELPQLSNFQRVSVKIKVVIKKEAEVLKGGLLKQECVVGDATRTCTIITWEGNVGIF